MFTHEEATDLLDATMSVLEGDLDKLIPQNGLGVIDQWLVELRKAENGKQMADTLEQVKTQLESDQINARELGKLLNSLSMQTVQFSTNLGSEGDIAPRLDGMAAALKSLAGQLPHDEQ